MKRLRVCILLTGLLVLLVFGRVHSYFWRGLRVELPTAYPITGYSKTVTLTGGQRLMQSFTPHDVMLKEMVVPIVEVDRLHASDSWLEFVLEHEQLKKPVVARIETFDLHAGEVVVVIEPDETLDWTSGKAELQLRVVGDGVVTLGLHHNPFMAVHRYPGELLANGDTVSGDVVFRPVFVDEQPATTYVNPVAEYWVAARQQPDFWLGIGVIVALVGGLGWLGLWVFLPEDVMYWHMVLGLMIWLVVYVSLRLGTV